MKTSKDWSRLVSARVFAVFAAIVIANFIAFIAIASYLGGDAVNGKYEGGHYYLFGVRTEKGIKVYTEVRKATFTYSKYHVYSIFITWPLLMIGAAANSYLKKRSGTATTIVSSRLRLPSRDWRTVYLHEVAIYEVFVPLMIVITGGAPPRWFFATQALGHLCGALVSNKFYWWYGKKAALGLSRILMALGGVGWIAAGYLFGR